MAKCEEQQRAAVADAVVVLAAARLWPHVKVEEIATLVGITRDDLREAVARRRKAVPRPSPVASVEQGRRISLRGEGTPPSRHHVWCSRGRHWVHVDEMARNRRRPGGLADWCLDCFYEYRKGTPRPSSSDYEAADAVRFARDEGADRSR